MICRFNQLDPVVLAEPPLGNLPIVTWGFGWWFPKALPQAVPITLFAGRFPIPHTAANLPIGGKRFLLHSNGERLRLSLQFLEAEQRLEKPGPG